MVPNQCYVDDFCGGVPLENNQTHFGKMHKHIWRHSHYSDIKLHWLATTFKTMKFSAVWMIVLASLQKLVTTWSQRTWTKHHLAPWVVRSIKRYVLATFFQTKFLCVLAYFLLHNFRSCEIILSSALSDVASASDSCCTEHFWLLTVVPSDPALEHGTFCNYMSSINTVFKPIHPGHHNKKVLESTHSVICSTFLWLISDSKDSLPLRALQAVSSSNDLYASVFLFNFETEKASTRCTTVSSSVIDVDQNHFNA